MISEYISQDVQVQVNLAINTDNTHCTITKNNNVFYLNYSLSGSDCLFDLDKKNYTIAIRIHENYFKKYTLPFSLNLQKQSICCNVQSKLFELISCQAQGIERTLLFEGIILSLLYYAKQSNIENSLCYESCVMLQQPLELQKIEAAKTFILQHLDQNITIPVISKAVGTNQCYLKKGFKQVVGKTIFEFVQENRMLKAQHLLKNTNKKLLEVAEIVGYASISSFSQAFKFYFGVSPSNIAKE